MEIVIPFRAVFKVFLYFNNSSKWSEFSFPFSFQFFTRLAAVFACYFSEDNQPLERNQSSKRAGHEEIGFLLGLKP